MTMWDLRQRKGVGAPLCRPTQEGSRSREGGAVGRRRRGLQGLVGAGRNQWESEREAPQPMQARDRTQTAGKGMVGRGQQLIASFFQNEAARSNPSIRISEGMLDCV